MHATLPSRPKITPETVSWHVVRRRHTDVERLGAKGRGSSVWVFWHLAMGAALGLARQRERPRGGRIGRPAVEPGAHVAHDGRGCTKHGRCAIGGRFDRFGLASPCLSSTITLSSCPSLWSGQVVAPRRASNDLVAASDDVAGRGCAALLAAGRFSLTTHRSGADAIGHARVVDPSGSGALRMVWRSDSAQAPRCADHWRDRQVVCPLGRIASSAVDRRRLGRGHGRAARRGAVAIVPARGRIGHATAVRVVMISVGAAKMRRRWRRRSPDLRRPERLRNRQRVHLVGTHARGCGPRKRRRRKVVRHSFFARGQPEFRV